MKKCFLILLILLIGLVQQIQAQDLIGKVFVTTSDQTMVFPVDTTRNADKTRSYIVRKGTKFSVIGFDSNNHILITFWRYFKPVERNDDGSKKKSNKDISGKGSISENYKEITKNNFYVYDAEKQFVGIWANYKQFAIDPRTLNSHCKQYYGHNVEFTWGVMTLPIKLRYGNNDDRYFDFEERLNLGFVFGYRQQLKGLVPHSVNYLAGFGISSVKTDSVSMKDVSFFNGSSSAGLSLHTGVMYQYEMFQVGLFIGGDFVPG